MASVPRIGVTIGDPAGIGPEITLKALADPAVRSACVSIVLGDAGVLHQAERFARAGLEVRVIPDPSEARNAPGVVELLDFGNVDLAALRLGEVDAACGRAMVDYLDRGVDLARAGKLAGLVVGPHNKEAVNPDPK